jgi:hypothetical protein
MDDHHWSNTTKLGKRKRKTLMEMCLLHWGRNQRPSRTQEMKVNKHGEKNISTFRCN